MTGDPLPPTPNDTDMGLIRHKHFILTYRVSWDFFARSVQNLPDRPCSWSSTLVWYTSQKGLKWHFLFLKRKKKWRSFRIIGLPLYSVRDEWYPPLPPWKLFGPPQSSSPQVTNNYWSVTSTRYPLCSYLLGFLASPPPEQYGLKGSWYILIRFFTSGVFWQNLSATLITHFLRLLYFLTE